MMGRFYCWAMIAWLVLLIGGCSPDGGEPGPIDEDTPPAIPAEEGATESGSSSVTLERPELPGDVFFEDPLAIAANTARLPGAADPPAEMAEAAAEEPMTSEPEESETPVKEAVDWASLLPAELLNEEVLRIRDRFAPKLEDVASYNSSMTELPPYLAEIAALAIIAGQHAEDVPWRADAKYVRDLAASAVSSELARGQNSYEQVKVPFDKVSALLDGKRPEELPEAEEEGSFIFAADFGYLMGRLEIGQNSLRTNGSSEEALSENASDLQREARVMAALAAVIAAEDYGYGEDPTYQGYAKELREAALNAAKAAQAKDFAGFDTARNVMMQSCNRCHSDYRTL